MASKDSINFGKAHKALMVAADAAPEWFALACAVHKATDNGQMLLLHALMQGLQQAYEAGKEKRTPFLNIAPVARDKRGRVTMENLKAEPTEPEPVAAPIRRGRTAPVAQAEYLQGIMNRDTAPRQRRGRRS